MAAFLQTQSSVLYSMHFSLVSFILLVLFEEMVATLILSVPR